MKYRDLMNFLDSETQHADDRCNDALRTENYSEALRQTTINYAMQRVKLWATAKQMSAHGFKRSG